MARSEPNLCTFAEQKHLIAKWFACHAYTGGGVLQDDQSRPWSTAIACEMITQNLIEFLQRLE